MSQRNVPKLSKWPFYVADLILVIFAFWLFSHYPHPLAPWAALSIAGCVVLAALVAVWPYRLEYEAAIKFAEAEGLTDVAGVICELEEAGQIIRQATAQWQGVQEHANRTTQSAREIADRMTAEARAFSEFMTRANDSEKATLRLEVDKLRRAEGQWLQITTHILDHIHALYQAGLRSGQPNLAAQLGSFQAACRDIVRRVGLFPIEVTENDAYIPEAHDVMEGQPTPGEAARVERLVATGFTFQGQVIRRPVVVLKSESEFSETPLATAAGQVSESVEDESPIVGEQIEIVRDPGILADIDSAMGISPSELEAAAGGAATNVEEFRLESEGTDEDGNLRTGNA